MTKDERLAPVRDAINQMFADEPTLAEGMAALKQLHQDVTIMLVAVETKMRSMTIDDVLTRVKQ